MLSFVQSLMYKVVKPGCPLIAATNLVRPPSAMESNGMGQHLV